MKRSRRDRACCDQARCAVCGLLLGASTYVNRDDVPLGTVIEQTPAPGREVAPASAVDLVVSGGPRIAIELDSPVLVAGQASPLAITVYANNGVPLSPQPGVLTSIEPVPGATSGSLPLIAGGALQTSTDTQGEYLLQVELPDTAERQSGREPRPGLCSQLRPASN